MRVKSNADCVQFYSGNGLDNIGGKTVIYKRRAGFALEPQVCPNAINIEGFLAPVLIKGAEYRKRIEYSFSAERFLL